MMTIVRTKITDLPPIPETLFVFESPDGGQTVYARPFRCKERILVKTADLDLMQQAKRANRLLAIFRKTTEDPTLNDVLEQLEALYILKYGEHDKND